MKKVFILPILMLLVISVMGLASAKTLIAGKIYTSDYSDYVADADVSVSCDDAGDISVENATSSDDGSYSVVFFSTKCNQNDTVTVYAEKNGMYGSKTGVVNDDVVDGLDLAIVNVPLIPEFGTFIGLLTIVSAMGVFFVVRRK